MDLPVQVGSLLKMDLYSADQCHYTPLDGGNVVVDDGNNFEDINESPSALARLRDVERTMHNKEIRHAWVNGEEAAWWT